MSPVLACLVFHRKSVNMEDDGKRKRKGNSGDIVRAATAAASAFAILFLSLFQLMCSLRPDVYHTAGRRLRYEPRHDTVAVEFPPRH